MAISKLAALFQGTAYVLISTLLMAYPQVLDILNYSDVAFTKAQYKECQIFVTPVWIIGIIFVMHGLCDWINTHVRPLFLGPSEIENGHCPVFFTMITTWDRIIVVPALLAIVLLTFGCDDVMLQVLSGLFCVIDPTLGFITIIILKKDEAQEDLISEHRRTIMMLQKKLVSLRKTNSLPSDRDQALRYIEQLTNIVRALQSVARNGKMKLKAATMPVPKTASSKKKKHWKRVAAVFFVVGTALGTGYCIYNSMGSFLGATGSI